MSSNMSYSFNIGRLKPVSQLAQRFGWKGCIFGGPGTGKTPLMMTGMSPVHAFIESGLSSVRTVSHQPGVTLGTYAEMRDYTLWATQSQEAKQFGLKTFDSYTQMADVILDEEKRINKDPRKSYGNMAEKMMEMMHWIFFAPDCDVLGLCKETLLEIEGQGKKYRPLFPGQALDAAIPHLFDSFWRLEKVPDGKGGLARVIRTQESFNAFARDRNGAFNQNGLWVPKMAELEAPDLTYLIGKAMSN
jgi:hypothetical protein